MGALKIPDDLLAQANRIPGLGERVARFIKLEVAQFEMRQKRFRPETLALVARAQAKAVEKRAAGADLDEERQAFLRRLEGMTLSDSCFPC
jgi:hypothetical protein